MCVILESEKEQCPYSLEQLLDIDYLPTANCHQTRNKNPTPNPPAAGGLREVR